MNRSLVKNSILVIGVIILAGFIIRGITSSFEHTSPTKKLSKHLIEVPQAYGPALPITTGVPVQSEFSQFTLGQNTPSARFAVGEHWVELTLKESNEEEPSTGDNQVTYKNVLKNTDVVFTGHNGYLNQYIVLNNKSAPKHISYEVSDSGNIVYKEIGGQIVMYDRDTRERVFIIRQPQGFDATQFPIDYRFYIDGEETDTMKWYDSIGELAMRPYRTEQFEGAQYPITLQPSFHVVAWDEALVKVGEDGGDAEHAKDGDIALVKPAGWNWGMQERKEFVIVRIPKLTEQERKDINHRTTRTPDAALVLDSKRAAFMDNLIRFGIDYTTLASPEELAIIRDPETENPVLDARENLKVVQKKNDLLASIIPNNRRLAYTPPKPPSLSNRIARTIAPNAQAQTTFTTTIGSGSCDGTCDYSTVAAWMTACGGATSCALTSNNEIVVGEMYDDSTFTEATTDIDGFTADATRTVTLTVASGERHSGVLGAGVDWAAAGDLVAASDDYVTIEWIQFRDWGSGASAKFPIDISRDNNTVRNNIVYGGSSPHATCAGIFISANADATEVYNNIVYGLPTSGTDPVGIGIGTDATGGTANSFYNNTAYGGKYGIACTDSTNDCILQNNIAMGSASGDFVGTFGSGSYNMSDDATGDDPGATGAIINETPSTEFTNLTGGSEDFHLLSSADAVGAGTDLSGTFTDDIDAETRSAWDMGADEYVVLNNAPTITSVTDSPDPIDIGKVVSFSTDWNDADAGDLIKVKICKTDALSAQVCSGGHFATSSAFTTTDPEVPTYTTLEADVGANSYYAFVCDDEAACSASTSGTFTVDDLTVDAASDTPDPTNPNRSVTFISDWSSGTGTVKIKVCKTDSLTAQVCDGGYWASSTVFTTHDPAQIHYDVVGGDAGQTRSYYVFTCDDSATCSTSTSGTFTVNLVSTVPNINVRKGVEIK